MNKLRLRMTPSPSDKVGQKKPMKVILEERDCQNKEGFIPFAPNTGEVQIKRALMQMRGFEKSLDKYVYLMNLAKNNHNLFYSVVLSNVDECLPLIYTPVVGAACVNYSKIWGMNPAFGLFLDTTMKGRLYNILGKWPTTPDIIVVTDGSRILGLGDLGANGMGISVGKLALYSAGAGFHPEKTLPITLDVGTNNEMNRADEFYIGQKIDRIRDQRFWDFMEEFIVSVKSLWPKCLVQFEDFSNDVSFDILSKYRSQIVSFNDDIQGTGAVITAGWINATRTCKLPITQQRFLFYGAGSAGVGVADQMKAYIRKNDPSISQEVIDKLFFMVDSRGLLTKPRLEDKNLASHKLGYVRKDLELTLENNLLEIVKFVRPTCLIGLCKQPKSFTEEILVEMGKYAERPIIMALSNPTSKAECSSIEAYEATDGRAIYMSGSRFPNWVNPKTGVEYHPGQGNNLYIFPGLGLGAVIGEAREVTDEMILEAAACLADMTSPQQIERMNMYPGLDKIREISKGIAERVARYAIDHGYSNVYEPNQEVDLKKKINDFVYTPQL